MIQENKLKIGRNSPCSCGSGKKYKKCCLPKKEGKQFRFLSYKVTSEPIPDEKLEEMERGDLNAFESICTKISRGKINNELIEHIKRLMEKYPEVSKLLNYLGVCYQHLGQHEESIKLIFEVYERFPEYLFGKTAMANYWINQDEHERVEDVFNGVFELQSLYPNRGTFHIAEVSAFSVTAGRYFVREGQVDAAREYLNLAKEVNINDPMINLLISEINA